MSLVAPRLRISRIQERGSKFFSVVRLEMFEVTGGGPICLKPNKPDPYDGLRDFLIVNTWLYKMEQYLVILQLGNPGQVLSEANKIVYTSTFLTGTAAVWWYTIVQASQVLTTWSDFRKKVVTEFVPSGHIRRSRDKLRRLKHTTSVSKYLAEFRNLILTIPNMSDEERQDRVYSGLKYDIMME